MIVLRMHFFANLLRDACENQIIPDLRIRVVEVIEIVLEAAAAAAAAGVVHS